MCVCRFFYSHSKEWKKIEEKFYPSADEEKVKHSQKPTQVRVCSSREKSKILTNEISLLIDKVLGQL